MSGKLDVVIEDRAIKPNNHDKEDTVVFILNKNKNKYDKDVKFTILCRQKGSMDTAVTTHLKKNEGSVVYLQLDVPNAKYLLNRIKEDKYVKDKIYYQNNMIVLISIELEDFKKEIYRIHNEKNKV